MQQTAQQLKLRYTPAENLTRQCLILRYYRVAQLIHDPQHLAVEPYAFESQMAYLAENFNVITLNELKQHIETSAPLLKNTVAVTFDVGYSDLLYTAKPVLERYNIPVTVFAASVGMLGEEQLWFDLLEDYLLAATLPDEIDLELDDKSVCMAVRNLRERFCAYEKLYQNLRTKTPQQQNQILQQLKSVAVIVDSELDNHRLLDNQELRALADSELISIGGYTHNCVDLKYLDLAEQQQEIYRNKQILEQILDTELDCFAYPFEPSADQSYHQTENLIRQAGYTMTMGNSFGMLSITEQKDCCQLPRVKVGNWNGFAFYQFLESFLTETTSETGWTFK
jgi:peptidoglycan/xylan/chitin deacetylase (PgdA/CDA1 family)